MVRGGEITVPNAEKQHPRGARACELPTQRRPSASPHLSLSKWQQRGSEASRLCVLRRAQAASLLRGGLRAPCQCVSRARWLAGLNTRTVGAVMFIERSVASSVARAWPSVSGSVLARE